MIYFYLFIYFINTLIMYYMNVINLSLILINTSIAKSNKNRAIIYDMGFSVIY